LRSYSAVQLFVERARAAHPSFDVTSRNGAAIAQICRRLDGVPLALELAAARLRGLSVEELAARLDQRFRLLTTGNRVALPRQQTLRATIDWSYDLLSTSERALFARLSVFAGAWTIEASEAVCAGDGIDGEAVLELLLRLVDKSLVVSEEDDDANQRYRLLETLRQYAREQLRASGQVEAVHSQHAAYFLELARRLELESAGPRQTNWLEGVADEEHNLGAALEWLEVNGDAERALEMAAVLWRFWEVRGYLSEGRARLAALLHLPGASAVTLARARVLEGAGVLAHFQGDLTSARALYKESLSLYRRCGEPRDATWVLIHLGWLWHDYGRYKAARRFLRQGLALAHESSDRTAIARCLRLLGLIAWGELDFAIARSLHEQSLALNREAGNRWGTAWALHLLGKDLLWQVDTSEADLYEAQVALEGSVAIWQGLGERRERAHANVDLALLAIRHCDLAKARRLLDESLSNFTELNARGDSIVMLHAYADLFAAQNELRRVVRVRGAVSALMPRMGMHPSPLRRAVADYQMESARAALSPTVVASEWAAGEALTLHEAVAYVRDEHGAALSGRAL
jgi:tetratricopeptide (TPR) repeat protein